MIKSEDKHLAAGANSCKDADTAVKFSLGVFIVPLSVSIVMVETKGSKICYLIL